MRAAIAAIADRITRKVPGVAVHLHADDAGQLDRCRTHREFNCTHARDPETTCRMVIEHATEITVSVTGAPTWNGTWRPAGSLAVDIHGVVTATTFGMDEGWASQHRELAGQCRHCHKRRARAVTVLLRDDTTGEVRPVGRSCLGDYTGGTVRAELLTELLTLGERIATVCEVVEAGPVDSAPTVDVVAVALMIVDVHGFIGAGKAGPGEDDTRTRLRQIITPWAGEPATGFDPAAPADLLDTERDRARAAIAAVLADTGGGDYLANLAAVIREPWCQVTGKGSKLGLLASLPGAAQRAREAAARRDERERVDAARSALPDAHIGTIRSKIEVTGRIDLVQKINGDYGMSTLVKVETPDGLVKMFTTAAGFADLEAGRTVTVTGTVKSHDTYQGRRETLLVRPKLVHAAAATA